MHRTFLNEVARDLDRELAGGCRCACAPKRAVTSLAVVATINGQEFVWDAASGSNDLNKIDGAALAAAVREG